MTTISLLGRTLVFCSLFFFLGYGLSLDQFAPIPASAPTSETTSDALERVQNQFRHDLESLQRAITAYDNAAARSGTTHVALRNHHTATRRAFKRCEYLLEYIEPATVKRHLNGAPLPTTEPKVPEVTVIEPTGLQPLDELVFADAPDRSEIARLTRRLRLDYDRIYAHVSTQRLQHRHVFEAAREQVIRIFTLGVTGFDTPASANLHALDEAGVALSRLRDVYGAYAGAVADRNEPLNRAITTAFDNGLRMLTEANFDAFDRLAFLRQCINPLTRGLPRAQELLDIEFADDNPRPVNPMAASIFSDDFLNVDYYARLSESPYAKERRELGERLFYDPILSENGEMSCASCHRPELAFTDGRARSTPNGRNAPSLINSVFAERYFYDLREEFLERQIKHVVFDPHEFATDFVSITERLREEDPYPERFAAAYSDQPRYTLTAWSISDALAHYVAGLTAFDSPFDRYARGQTEEIDPAVARGYNLFSGKAACATCHFPPTFSGLVPPFYRESETEVLGVPATAVWRDAPLDPDRGRVANGRPRDEAYFRAFSFKTPTVRNVTATAPYMHNGVYGTLEEVVRFYNVGGGKGIGIHLEHQTLPFDSLGLNQTEMDDIVNFMEALTDYDGSAR